MSRAGYAWTAPKRTLPKRPVAERIRDFRETYLGFDEATVREQAGRCIQCGVPGCVQACPLSNRIPEWLALAADGAFLEAAEVSRSTSNLPEICSRVCPQSRLCEGGCVLNGKSEAVAIGAVERFINDYAFARGAVSPRRAASNGGSVAVVGSGPGGLACADELARRGFAVTVFESQEIPGGLLVHGIPAFKLDKALVSRRVELLRGLGVEFRLGLRIGWDVSLAELRRSFDAIFLAIGAQRPRPLDVPGADLPGVGQALPFLAEWNARSGPSPGPNPVAGRRVVVLGGGDTAMDCLRTAVRLGAADALCAYRRDLANMPGSRKDYATALEEGARFDFLVNPVAIEADGNGHAGRVRCVRMELGEPDAQGRRTPRPIPGSDYSIFADFILIAYGFDPVPFPAESDFRAIPVTRWGTFAVDGDQMTSVPGVFAGGDSVRGPSLVANAVRDGRRAAAAISRQLCGRAVVAG